MDNRWRFLYCFMTELWGRMEEGRAGKGKTGASTTGGELAKPFPDPKVRGGAKKSSEARGGCAKKSRYCS